uniref:Uncharacterized protein n=1 Tax=Rousettus aegyptiacus TaxID=9407 RepID=A0A7J8DY56_ROUAE|nr:hypothetical protein HJG63_008301 [Rousettus aegyptiacus]
MLSLLCLRSTKFSELLVPTGGCNPERPRKQGEASQKGAWGPRQVVSRSPSNVACSKGTSVFCPPPSLPRAFASFVSLFRTERSCADTAHRCLCFSGEVDLCPEGSAHCGVTGGRAQGGRR